uniref:dynamin-related protein 4C-like n=1 Tax=Erigeron canadensis TaxID=72917 RepID=UPI001CB93E1B|nr:dynamin-related protein 4C-like [Erigeron canadensis]
MGGGNIISADPKMINNKVVAGENNEALINLDPLEKVVLVDDDDDKSSKLNLSSSPPPLVLSYNEVIRPLRDTVHTLVCMNVIEECIYIPTIVVIGDQSSGKSSLIESLTGISLPHGEGICTRVPLIMKLQHHIDPVSQFIQLEYFGNSVPVDQTSNISEAVNLATEKIAGNQKMISGVPLTLVVKQNSVPDLTIIDLPGIPINDQSENSYHKKIDDIIEKYIGPEGTIILNVVSATADFLTCKSMQMSLKLDETGQRTLHVFTKSDKASEDMVAVATTSTGTDFVCVVNRIGEETYQEARTKEANLFQTHHLLSGFNKSMVGTHVVAQKLVVMQLGSLSKSLHLILKKINEDLNITVLAQNKLEKQFTTISEAMPTFLHISKMSEKSLAKIVVSCEFDDFLDDTQMHCSARLSNMLNEFLKNLKENQVNHWKHIDDEIPQLLEERKGSCSPSLLVEHVFNFLLQRQIVSMSGVIDSFTTRVWDYIEAVMVKVLVLHTKDDYPQLVLIVKAAAKNAIVKLKERLRFKDNVLELLEVKNMEELKLNKLVPPYNNKSLGTLAVYSETTLNQALEIETRMMAFWEFVHSSFIDSVEENVKSMMNEIIVETEMEKELMNELKTNGENRYKRMLEESPWMTMKRWKLKNRIELVEKFKKVIEKEIDEISFHGY